MFGEYIVGRNANHKISFSIENEAYIFSLSALIISPTCFSHSTMAIP